MLKLPIAFAALAMLSTNACAQSLWSAAATQSTSSLHSGQPGGTHENVEVSNSVFAGGGDSVTLTIVHFVPDGNGGYDEVTKSISIPYGQRRSFHVDVKSVVVTAGNTDAKGEYTVTYP